MINLKKACACLLTVAASVGVNFSLNSMAMYNDMFKCFDRCWDNRSIRKIIFDEIITEHKNEAFYLLPLADEPAKCIVVNKDLTKCVYVDVKMKSAVLGKMLLGYGNEKD